MNLNIFDEIKQERDSQDKKWGEQNHPSKLVYPDNKLPTEKQIKDHNFYCVNQNTLSWGGIALEELIEANEAPNEELMRAELVQLAAVAVAWIECLDRKKHK